MLYSLRSFPSASALPLRRRRWASAGGADGCAASWDFIAEIVSVGCTPSVKLARGFRDLNVSEIKAVKESARDASFNPILAKFLMHLPPDDEASASLRSGGGGTVICARNNE